MNVQETKEQLIAELIRLAFAEDIGDGDHTTLCCIPATEMGKSQLIVKEDGVLAGVEMAERIFHTFDPDLKMTTFIHDGAEVKKGDIAFVVEGKVQSLLQNTKSSSDGETYAQCHATHEWYCNHDTQICQSIGRNENTRTGYA